MNPPTCHWWNATSLCPPPGWDNLWVPLWCVGSVAAVGVVVVLIVLRVTRRRAS